ncbi:MAG: hypothetical protein ABFD54_13095 [Armatimonadota bacterium]|nr:hypothetical protein [bacterium]
MKTLKQSPYGRIQELRNMLRDRYDEGSVVKEIVQNADDAGATELHLAPVSCLPGSEHPMLCSPAVVVLNNGEFCPEHEEALTDIGAGTKGANQDKVGKFGLGMKSVFHWCEAFLYSFSENQPARNGRIGDIVSPWFDLEKHNDWELQNNDRDYLHSYLDKWPHGCARWFCLWLPLRTQNQLDGRDAIRRDFPDTDVINIPDMADQIAIMMPLLKNVRQVTFWRDANGQLTDQCRVTLSKDSTRRTLSEMQSDQDRDFCGTVEIEESSQHTHIRYCGREAVSSDRRFDEIKQLDTWPRSASIQSDGTTEEVPDKAMPHGAVVFCFRDSATFTSMAIRKCVFLPLSDDAETPTGNICPSVELLLHGCFFLDSGRKRIEADNDWNKLIEEQIVTRLLLPTLYDSITKFGLDPAHVGHIVSALADSEFCKEHIQQICQEQQLLPVVNGGKCVWKLESTQLDYRCLPGSYEQLETCLELFPALLSLSGSIPVVMRRSPRISARLPRGWQNHANSLLAETPPEILRQSKALQYFHEFSTAKRLLALDPAWDRVVALLQAARSQGRLVGLADQAFQQVIVDVPESYKVYVSDLDRPRDLDVNALDAFMSRTGISFILLPTIPDSGGRGICIDESLSLLEYLADGDLTASRSNLALIILRATKGERLEKLQSLGHFRLFRAQQLGSQEEHAFTWHELDELHSQKKILGGNLDKKLLTGLQEALQKWEAWRLPEDPRSRLASTALFAGQVPPEFDLHYVSALLATMPALNSPEQRANLLNSLLSADLESDLPSVKAVRYLLHGDTHLYDQVDMPLFATTSSTSVWDVVIKWIYSKQDRVSCIIPFQLAQLIAPRCWDALELENLSPKTVERLLSEDPEILTGLDLDEDQRIELLTEIRDDELWKRIPIHRSADGREHAIVAGQAFRVRDYPVPSSLVGSVDQIEVLPSLEARYERLVPMWEPARLIETALSVDHAEQYASDVMAALGTLSTTQLPSEITETVRSRPWLPTNGDGSPVAPQDVLYIPEIQDVLERISSDSRLCQPVMYERLLATTIENSPQLGVLRDRFFTKGKQAISLLGEVLQNTPEYAIGPFETARAELAPVFARALPNLNSELPGLRVLGEVYAALGSGAAESLAKYLLGPINKREILTTLVALEDPAASDAAAEIVFADYLRLLVWCSDFSVSDLRQLKLKTESGRWQPAACLTIEEGVHSDARLCENHREILEQVLMSIATYSQQPTGAVPLPQPNLTDVTPLEYFRDWGSVISFEVMGLFLSLLGDATSILHQAVEWLQPRFRIRELREQVKWNGAWEALLARFNDQVKEHLKAHTTPVYTELSRLILTTPEEDRAELRNLFRDVAHVELCRTLDYQSLESFDVHQVMRSTIVSLQCTDAGSPIMVLNLLGDPINVEQTQHFDHLLLGNPIVTRNAQSVHARIRLRKIDPASYTPAKLHDLLYQTLCGILRTVFRVEPTNLGNTWELLTQTDQADLAIAQQMILDDALFYFQQLTDRNLGKLKGFAKRRDDLRYLSYQYRSSHDSLPENVRDEIRRETIQLRADLRQSFEQDADFQREALTAVRRRVEDNRYSPQSIPFELFQNADDAVVELRSAGGVNDDELASTIEFHWTGNEICVCHWGRPVNAFRFPSISVDDARKRGYDRDLQKMLVLSFSSKSESDDTTGQFGLGFKSVFLFSDRPCIRSGNLGCRIVGGMYPKRLSSQDRAALSGNHHQSTSQPGTVISLRSNGELTAPAVMERFCSLAHIQIGFSRAICTCRLVFDEDADKVLQWCEQKLGNTGAAVAELTQYRGQQMRCIVIRGENNSSVMFGLKKTGFVRLPDDVPTFWVTAPTSELLSAGIAVNGNFGLDVGRARLSCNSETTSNTAAEAGDALGRALLNLFDFSNSDWDGFRSAMSLDAQCGQYDFWNSLWQLTSSANCTVDDRGQSPNGILRNIIWSEGFGMSLLLHTRSAVPSGLEGKFQCLVGISEIRRIICGVLRTENILQRCWELHLLDDVGIAPGNSVSEAIADGLQRVSSRMPAIATTMLADVVTTALRARNEAVPIVANSLGMLVNEDLFNRERHPNRHDYSKELDDLKNYLKLLKFETQDGFMRACTDVLVESAAEHEEESLRAAFAPASHLLSTSYDEHGVAFFLCCRRAMTAPAEKLVEWGLQAQSDQSRKAFIAYMSRGELALRVRELAASKRDSTWLDDPHSGYFSELTRKQAIGLQAELDMDIEEMSPGSGAISSVMVGSPDLLMRMYSWWQDCGKQMLREYEKQTYPDPDWLFANLKGDYRDSQEERETWLELLLRGSLETMGRCKPRQHRGFLDLCKRNGWISELAATSDVPEALVRMIQSYIDRQAQRVEYFQWIKQFVPMFLISKWLGDYARSFLMAPHLAHHTMDIIVAPRINSSLGPGDPDSPPIKDVLGIGAHFVLRELVRKGVIANEKLEPLCYVPSARVRRLANYSGITVDFACPHELASRAIYDGAESFLGDGTFCNSFDIPFQMVDRIDDLELRSRLDLYDNSGGEDWI